MTNCGNGGSGSESCCTSLPVTGGLYYRSYDGITYTDSTSPATVANLQLDKYEITVGRFRQFVASWDSGWRPVQGAGVHTYLPGGGLVNSASADAGVVYEMGWDTSWASSLATDNTTWSDTNHLSCDPTYQTWTPSATTNERRPLNCETWYEAYAFCIWDGGFLPSEAEWNYAATGGGEQRAYPWSAAYPPDSGTAIGCTYANYGGTTWPSTACVAAGTNNVGTESPMGNGNYGQADLAGNVWEWNLDWYAGYVTPCVNCAYLPTTAYGRVLRGGGFDFNASDLLASNRSYGAPTNRYKHIGARCARAP